MSSLVPNAPVKLNNVDVHGDKALISDQEILTIGSCSFRFEYMQGSPLQETNGSTVTPSKVGLH